MSYRAKCEKVQDDTYEFLKRDEGVHWFCKHCDKGLVKMFTVIKKLNDKQLDLERRQTALESEVNGVKGTLNDMKGDLSQAMKLATETDSKLEFITDASW